MFLQDVSKDLLQRFGHNLSDVTVVFPGKRARLFMNQYLARLSDRPVWAPQYKTIDELFCELSPYTKADPIGAVCELYRLYASLLPDAEPLDEFYSWGEIILSDFDDIDKHIAPAHRIFRNVHDLHAISTDYIDPRQEEALREFFKNFSIEQNTELKQRFLRLWDHMYDLYEGLRQSLMQRGELYPGALYRDVAERIRKHTLDAIIPEGRTYAFVGFNILDETEQTLFQHYHHRHQALFYWDYDLLYLQDERWEAGHFIAQNLKLFPNALSPAHFDNLRHLKDITFVATSTQNAQSRYIPEWLEQHLTPQENETAIVLADEHTLANVLHSIPKETPELINVTMGFPLSDTPVYSFLHVLMALYIDGYDSGTHTYRHTFLERVTRHPYSRHIQMEGDDSLDLLSPVPMDCATLLKRLMVAIQRISLHYASKEQPNVYDQLYTEALFQCHCIATRFSTLVDTTLHIQPPTLRRLLGQVFASTSIPFHGEPAIGLQVMGLLETRNINFRNLLMLGVNEGILPKKNDDNSLIPYILRDSFGLTTLTHRISVFAYYFYRLISRCEHVTLVFNENNTGTTAGEMSRFMRQLMAETDLPIRYLRLMPSNRPTPPMVSDCVVKTPEMLALLRERYLNNSRHTLSPTAINAFTACPLRFYLRYVAELRIPDNVEDGITPALFGIIFHDAAQLFYQHLWQHLAQQGGGTAVTAEQLEEVLEKKELRLFPFLDVSMAVNYIQPLDDEAKEALFLKLSHAPLQEVREYAAQCCGAADPATVLSGLNHIIYGVLKQYITHLLRYDRTQAPFTLVALEKDYYCRITLPGGDTVRTGGRIDRLERDAGGRLIVVDYKTGGQPAPVRDIDSIVQHSERASGYYLQTFLYALAVQQQEGGAVQPSLCYVNRSGRLSTFSRTMYMGTEKNNVPIEDIMPYREEFLQKLTEVVGRIFDPAEPFCATVEKTACEYCDYKRLCGKE